MLNSSATAQQLFVKRLASRSSLTQEETDAILGLRGPVINVAAHKDFVRLGEHVDHACLVVEGVVARFGQNADGDRQITCFYIKGDMADLGSVVSPKSAWGLIALCNARIMRVSHASLRRIAAQHPGIAEALWRDCVADGSFVSEWVLNLGRRGALSRIAHVLCEMAIRFERVGQGNRSRFSLPVTQSDLGDATGLTSVHVNRTLRELRERSVVSLRSGEVIVHDWDQLALIGDFDATFMLLDGPSPRVLENADTSRREPAPRMHLRG